MNQEYTIAKMFYELPIDTQFLYKPVFAEGIVYKKIRPTRKGGLTYNAVRVDINRYESFDEYNTVRVKQE